MGPQAVWPQGEKKLVVASIARKLTVAIWYLMMGRWTPQKEVDGRTSQKIGSIISAILPAALNERGWTRRSLRAEMVDRIKTGRSYVLRTRPQ